MKTIILKTIFPSFRKNISFVLFISFLCFFNNAQAQNTSLLKCGTQVPANAKAFNKSINNILSTNATMQNLQAGSLPCLGRTLSLSVHVIEDSLGVQAASISDVQNMIASLNTAFAPICLSFSLCKFEVIKNYKYSNFFSFTDEPEVVALYNDPNMINIYCPKTVIVGPAIGFGSVVGGYSPLGGGPGANTVLVGGADGGVAIHELGHFFGLSHTFETVYGIEFVNGSNCPTTGDLICDTEADFNAQLYNPSVFDPLCNYIGNITDVNGDFYTPMVSNYMSYSPCSCKFTRGQYMRMVATYLSNSYKLY
jgi:Pregnancy-associated plasma protein-A